MAIDTTTDVYRVSGINIDDYVPDPVEYGFVNIDNSIDEHIEHMIERDFLSQNNQAEASAEDHLVPEEEFKTIFDVNDEEENEEVIYNA